MKIVKLYAVPNEYEPDGWSYAHVGLHEWNRYESTTSQDYPSVFLGEIAFHEPSTQQLKALCEMQVNKMEDRLEKETTRLASAIKEYESKFLLLTND